MKLLVTGGGGQVAEALRRELAKSGHPDYEIFSRSALDIGDQAAVNKVLRQEGPDVVVNAAAFTAVDAAESAVDEAERVNGHGVEYLARAAIDIGARLVHISTDFVFDGSASTPIPPEAVPCPISVYGASKLLGEKACEEILGDDQLVVRTSWVYDPGGRNFVATMLRLGETHPELRVVADQFGAPTRASTIANVILAMVEKDVRGVHHVTDAGLTTWFDFAVSIFDIAVKVGILSQAPVVVPISTEEFPCAAARPRYSVLDTASARRACGVEFQYWRCNLESAIASWNDGNVI